MRPFCLLLLALASGCVHLADQIPAKAADDLGCPLASIQVVELEGGDTGTHRASGCDKQATYELNPLKRWVVQGPITTAPSHVTPEPGR